MVPGEGVLFLLSGPVGPELRGFCLLHKASHLASLPLCSGGHV